MNFRRSSLGFLLLILLLGGILSWRLWIYKSAVTFSAPAAFSLTLRRADEIKGTEMACSNTSCQFSLTPDRYEVSVRAPGFLSVEQEISIKWREENSFHFELVPLPTLAELPTAPESWQEAEKKDSAAQSAFFLDGTGKLFQKQEEAAVFIAEFPPEEAASFHIFPGAEEMLYLLHPQKVYEVQVQEKRKYKLLTAAPGESFTGMMVLQKNTLLVDRQNSVGAHGITLFFPETRTPQPLSETLALNLACENPATPGELLFLTPAANGSWLLQKLNLQQAVSVQTLTSAVLSGTPEKIRCETPKSILLKTNTEFFRISF